MASGIKVKFTFDMDQFLRENYQSKTNPALAQCLGLTLTVTRNRLSALGLKRMEMEYWTQEQIDYLKAKYKTTGNVELALYFDRNWPKNKRWDKRHISKKMGYLGLKRTQLQIDSIVEDNNAIRLNESLLNKQRGAKKVLNPLWLDSKTVIYVKPGVDINKVRQRFNERLT